ncbi:MAG: hypothetical protein A3E83_04640 [Gammaproteobacteria bacterium RIFCSPHIGHO2_12_FULL_41_20]|nr:MAG: hypothetical protein A3E83_04640 [Gammaproteobacteria bacterium RIFCSPHIGHO2_12_FULL_41_20]
MLFSHNPSLEQAKQYIYSIDFSMIIQKMVNHDGWCESDAVKTADLYRNFLYLNKKYATETILPPSQDVDEFWHYHILDTKKYIQDCENIFGGYFHHYPYLIIDHQLDQHGLSQAFMRTQTLHIEEFGSPIYATRSSCLPFWYSLKRGFVKVKCLALYFYCISKCKENS